MNSPRTGESKQAFSPSRRSRVPRSSASRISAVCEPDASRRHRPDPFPSHASTFHGPLVNYFPFYNKVAIFEPRRRGENSSPSVFVLEHGGQVGASPYGRAFVRSRTGEQLDKGWRRSHRSGYTRSLHDVPDRADIGLIADPRSRRSRAPGILVGLHLNSKTGRRIIDQPIKQTQTRELKLRRKEGPVNAQDWSSDVNIFSNPSHVTTRESPSSRRACATISGGHSAMRCAKPPRSPANRARDASSKPGKSPAMACRKR